MPRTQIHRLADLDPEAKRATCRHCGPVDVQLKRGSKGPYWRCAEAVRADRRAWHNANQDKSAEHRRRHHLLSRYGLTVEGYLALSEKQGGVCLICHQPEEGNLSLAVDHDHDCCPGERTCGQCIRGLLCNRCNNGLGYFRHDTALLEQAAAYLTRA